MNDRDLTSVSPRLGEWGREKRKLATGLAAGCTYLTVELLGRLAGVPTIPEMVQDALLLLLPGRVFAFLLDRLRYLAKPMLFAGLLISQLVTLGLVHVATARWRHPFRVALLLWLATGFGLLPLTGNGPMGRRLGVALTSLASFAAYAVGLVFFADRQATRMGAPRNQPNAVTRFAEWLNPDAGQRRLIFGGALFVASAFLARRVLGSVPSLPECGRETRRTPSARALSATSPAGNVGSPLPGLPPMLTPASDFYVVSKNIVDPEVSLASWHLKVVGMVDRPLDLSDDDVRALPAQRVYRTLECISNEVGGNLISNGQWTGVRLGDLLERAGVQEGAQVLHFTSADGYTENMPIAQALLPSTILAYQLDDAPLPREHGFPLRVLGSGTFGMKNPKWLTRIEVAHAGEPGFWEQRGWDADAIVQTMSRIDVPTDRAPVQGTPIEVAGVAFAGDRGIQRVEIASDGETTWQAAELFPSLGANTWVFWHYQWSPRRVGSHVLVVRATDGRGQVQTAVERGTFPAGATGYHEVEVQVLSVRASQSSGLPLNPIRASRM